MKERVLITGDHNTVYPYILQHYPSLKDFVADFSGDIAEHTHRFVGRDFVFRDWLEPFLAQHPCGYLHIVADAGLGKTAIAAAAPAATRPQPFSSTRAAAWCAPKAAFATSAPK